MTPTRRKPPARPAEPAVASAPDLAGQLVEAWAVNNRINLMMLEHTSDEALAATLSRRGGRTVARQLAHAHMVRVRWLESSHGRDLVMALPRFDPKAEPTRAQLIHALTASAEAVAVFLGDVATGRRDSRPLKRGVGVWFGYLIAHEAHHRGSILLTLKQTGHALDDSLRWGIWGWDTV